MTPSGNSGEAGVSGETGEWRDHGGRDFELGEVGGSIP